MRRTLRQSAGSLFAEYPPNVRDREAGLQGDVSTPSQSKNPERRRLRCDLDRASGSQC